MAGAVIIAGAPWIVWDGDGAHLGEVVDAARAKLPAPDRERFAPVHVVTGPAGTTLDILCAALDADRTVRLTRRGLVTAVIFAEVPAVELEVGS